MTKKQTTQKNEVLAEHREHAGILDEPLPPGSDQSGDSHERLAKAANDAALAAGQIPSEPAW